MWPFLLWGLVLCTSMSAYGLRLKYYGEAALPKDLKYKGTPVGGLSGLSWDGQRLWAVSDDRGRQADPRFYGFDLTISPKNIQLKPIQVHFFKSFPGKKGRPAALDVEGLAKMPEGFLVSTEGNNDAKPRLWPQVSYMTADGNWQKDLEIPGKYLPEPTGLQTKGIQNNRGFEGLSVLIDTKVAFVAVESSLVQDYLEVEEAKGDWIRILKFTDKAGKGLAPAAEFAYRLEPLKGSFGGHEVFRGVSEILAIDEQRLLLLERGVRLLPKKLWVNSAAIYEVDLSKATDVSGQERLQLGKFVGVTKKLLVDFEGDLQKIRSGKSAQNYEALSWGPLLPDGRRSLLVISDNNFSKKEITELVVFAVEGE